MRKLFIALGLAIASLALLPLAACSSSHESATLVAAANPPVADVPIPSGFKLDADSSRSVVGAGGTLRWVDHNYHGDDGELSVVRFYRDNMPSNNWKLVSQAENGDDIDLSFSKGKESCAISVSRTWFYTNIHVSIYPVNQ